MSSFHATKIGQLQLVYTSEQTAHFQDFLKSLETRLDSVGNRGHFEGSDGPLKKRAVLKLARTFEKAARHAVDPFRPAGDVRYNLYGRPLQMTILTPSQDFDGQIISPPSKYQTTRENTADLATAMAQCRIIVRQQRHLDLPLGKGQNNLIYQLGRFETALKNAADTDPKYFEVYRVTPGL